MNRTLAFCRVFGWQGGTVHQVADVIGCSVDDILYGPEGKYCTEIDFEQGYWTGRKFFQNDSYPHHINLYNFARLIQGNVAFWLGVAKGYIEEHPEG